jgi:hypothetical protein
MRVRSDFGAGYPIAIGIVLTIIFATVPARARCDDHAGDDLHRWVDISAGPRSRSLASADFPVRLLNMFKLQIDDLNQRLSAVADRLNSARDHIRMAEAATQGDSRIDAALKREGDAQNFLNELVAVNTILGDITIQQSNLDKDPTESWIEDWILMNGLQNVGRASLIESLVQLGDKSKDSLREQYSVCFQVSAGENGQVTSASGPGCVGGWDDILAGYVGAHYFPYGTAIAVAYEAGKFINSLKECQNEIDHQQDLVRDAFGLLPSKLITKDEQIADVRAAYSAARGQFKPVFDAGVQFRNALEGQWKELLAFNVSRLDAAHTVLTAEKVDAIQKAFGSDSHLDSILHSSAIIGLSGDLGNLNSFLARGQLSAIQSCASRSGAETVEDQLDSIVVARSIYSTLRTTVAIAPIFRYLDLSDGKADSFGSEASGIWTNLRSRDCGRLEVKNNPSDVSSSKLNPELQRSIDAVGTRLSLEPAFKVVKIHVPVSAEAHDLTLLSPLFAQTLYCELHYDNSGALSCDADGPSYNGTLNQEPGPIASPDDGGYAQDNHRMESEINAADNNILYRIATLSKDRQVLLAALPEYTTKNAAALAVAEQQSQAAKAMVQADRQAFSAALVPELAASKQAVNSFLTSPFDPGATKAFITSAGGSDLSLPAITIDKLVPGLPAITGISAPQRLFGSEASPEFQRIQREQAKVQLELSADRPALELADRELSVAKIFAGHPGSEAANIASALTQDAKSLRYAKGGKLDEASYSYISDGRIIQSPLDPGNIPPESSILARGEVFQANSAIIDQQVAIVGNSLMADDPNVAPRRVLLQVATSLTQKSSDLFFGGNLSGGEQVQKVAFLTLDLATRFTPGVNWGRDVYEALTGKDLLTGQELDDFGRAVAIIGAISGGLGEDLVGGIRVLSEVTEFGRSVEEDDRIYEFAQTLDHQTPLDFSNHVVEDYMGNTIVRDIPDDLIKETLDRHEPFWNFRNNTYVAVGDEVINGERMGIAINVEKNKVTTIMYMPEDYNTILSEVIKDPNTDQAVKKAYVRLILK